MTISFVAAATNVGKGVSSLAVNVPAGTVAGDVMIAAIVCSNQNVSTPSGWTLVRATSWNLRENVYYRVATAAEPASYTWTPAAVTHISGAILTYRGVDTTTPVNVSAAQTATSGTITAPSVTTTINDCKVLAICGIELAATVPTPSSTTSRASVTGPAGVPASFHIGDFDQVVAGATTARTSSTPTEDNIGTTIALNVGPTFATVKHWDGVAWTAKPLKRWNGTAWVEVDAAKFKHWNGTAWVQA